MESCRRELGRRSRLVDGVAVVIGLRSQFGVSLLLAAGVGLVSWAVAVITAWRRHVNGRPWTAVAARILAAGAVVATIVATALPRRLAIESDGDLVLQLGRGGLSEWRILFTEPPSLASILLVANVLLYGAVGFTAVLGWYRQRRLVLLACLGISALIEMAQYAFLGRVASLDDLLLNWAGAVIGYSAAIAVVHRRERSSTGATTAGFLVRARRRSGLLPKRS